MQYVYSREVGASGWNVENINRPGLRTEIENAGLVGLERIDCDGSVVTITFMAAIDEPTLAAVVEAHKTDPV